MNVLGEIPAAGSRAILLQIAPLPPKPQWKTPGCSSTVSRQHARAHRHALCPGGVAVEQHFHCAKC